MGRKVAAVSMTARQCLNLAPIMAASAAGTAFERTQRR